jgi:hypothetical protein
VWSSPLFCCHLLPMFQFSADDDDSKTGTGACPLGAPRLVPHTCVHVRSQLRPANVRSWFCCLLRLRCLALPPFQWWASPSPNLLCLCVASLGQVRTRYVPRPHGSCVCHAYLCHPPLPPPADTPRTPPRPPLRRDVVGCTAERPTIPPPPPATSPPLVTSLLPPTPYPRQLAPAQLFEWESLQWTIHGPHVIALSSTHHKHVGASETPGKPRARRTAVPQLGPVVPQPGSPHCPAPVALSTLRL